MLFELAGLSLQLFVSICDAGGRPGLASHKEEKSRKGIRKSSTMPVVKQDSDGLRKLK